jgi:hypothetical protein
MNHWDKRFAQCDISWFSAAAVENRRVHKRDIQRYHAMKQGRLQNDWGNAYFAKPPVIGGEVQASAEAVDEGREDWRTAAGAGRHFLRVGALVNVDWLDIEQLDNPDGEEDRVMGTIEAYRPRRAEKPEQWRVLGPGGAVVCLEEREAMCALQAHAHRAEWLIQDAAHMAAEALLQVQMKTRMVLQLEQDAKTRGHWNSPTEPALPAQQLWRSDKARKVVSGEALDKDNRASDAELQRLGVVMIDDITAGEREVIEQIRGNASMDEDTKVTEVAYVLRPAPSPVWKKCPTQYTSQRAGRSKRGDVKLLDQLGFPQRTHSAMPLSYKRRQARNLENQKTSGFVARYDLAAVGKNSAAAGAGELSDGKEGSGSDEDDDEFFDASDGSDGDDDYEGLDNGGGGQEAGAEAGAGPEEDAPVWGEGGGGGSAAVPRTLDDVLRQAISDTNHEIKKSKGRLDLMDENNLPRRSNVNLDQGVNEVHLPPSGAPNEDHVFVAGHWPTNSALKRSGRIFSDITNMTTM